ncbi:MAG TPA: multidrug efflux SMR transporter [Mycobacteriales bacterium]|jgi:quaternary ammonium compound-resistance protein SugE|nr:multidrug efflux SMR transporter [Mycobacteriales bacterium]
MTWLALVVSGLLETVWAAALAESKGFTRPAPVAVFFLGLVGSICGLAYALRTLPMGTGYVIWVGIGAVGTALYGMVARAEPVTMARIACLALIVAGVVGLKLVH